MISVETQTDIQDKRCAKHPGTTEDLQEDKIDPNVSVVRSTSWKHIPGIQLSTVKRKRKHRIKWIPY